MKKLTFTVLLLVILVAGFVLVNASNFGAAIPTEKQNSGHKPQDSTPSPAPSSAPIAADKPAKGNGDGNNGNGNSVGSANDNGNKGGGNGGNGNGNNVDNGNGNNGNHNGNGNGSGNSNGNQGNGNNGSGNDGSNGNSGNGNSGNGNGNGGGNGNGNSNNGNGGGNGNGNNGNGNGDNGNGGSNDNNGNGGNGNNGNDNGNNGNGNDNNGNNGNGGSGNNGNGNGNGGESNPNKRYKVSGYILDSDGNGIAGAEIIFCVPDIVPAQFSDSSGYYEMNAPAGKYQVDVWPPFDSHYIFFEQKYLTVTEDLQKNITLPTGYRLSGTITDTSGAPVQGAVVWLDSKTGGSYFFCGWYSRYDGRYFVTAPPGTYTLNLKPKTGLSFPTYSDSVTLTGDFEKDIVLGGSAPASNPTNSHQASLSMAVDAKTLTAGSALNITGKLSDQSGNALEGKTVILSYSVADSGVWIPVGSGITDTLGAYRIEWLVPASGVFTLKVDWAGSSEYAAANAKITQNFAPSTGATC